MCIYIYILCNVRIVWITFEWHELNSNADLFIIRGRTSATTEESLNHSFYQSSSSKLQSSFIVIGSANVRCVICNVPRLTNCGWNKKANTECPTSQTIELFRLSGWLFILPIFCTPPPKIPFHEYTPPWIPLIPPPTSSTRKTIQPWAGHKCKLNEMGNGNTSVSSRMGALRIILF